MLYKCRGQHVVQLHELHGRVAQLDARALGGNGGARSLRRDCEESDQIWASCSDVTITA